MAEESAAASDKHLTFNVKSSSDAKYTVTVPDTMTVLQLKEKLSTSEYANVEPSRQRLIYSGRVLKDHEALSLYNIKDGNTVHLVKGAASNQQRNPASQDSAVPGAGQTPSIPSNIAAGTGNDPLAGLTGARYAGFAQMPGADTFGPDGGMGPDNPDRLLEMLDNPMFQSQMNEAMNNPQVIQMMQNSPMIRNNPMLRNMLNNPEFRRMMMDPNVIRQSMQYSRMMGGMGGMGGQGNMPAPGVTDTTPENQQSQQGATTGTNPSQNNQNPSQQQPPPFNPFMFMPPGAGGAAGAASGQQNPFAALFDGMNPSAAGQGQGESTPSTTGTTQQTTGQQTQAQGGEQQREGTDAQNQQSQQQNPLASLLAAGAGGPGNDQYLNHLSQQMMQQAQQNPDLMRQAMQAMLGVDPGAQSGQQGHQGPGAGGFNPFSLLGGGLGGGMGGGLGGGLGDFGASQQPADNRPPEELYADQLRQLNDMGFFNFQQNVRALRMSGGRVEGAVEMLLSGNV